MQKRLITRKHGRNRWVLILLVFVIVVLLLFAIRSCYQKEKPDEVKSGTGDSTGIVIDSISENTDSIADTLSGSETEKVNVDTVIKVSVDTVSGKKQRKASKKRIVDTSGISGSTIDSVKNVTGEQKDTISDTMNSVQRDTQTVKQDTVTMRIEARCSEDTTGLWIYPDPSGGLHRLPQKIQFYSNRSCSIFWRIKGSQEWLTWDGSEIHIEKTGTIQFSGVDTCGKEMELREEYYEIEQEVKSVCPDRMAHVVVGEVSFCADVYEWPNKKGVSPTAYVSLYQASDSCFSIGKRLCTADEWLLACSGPFSYPYPYGNGYEERACVTADTIVKKSGEKPECRSYFGLYDMSGNLQEWTDTRASENNRFNYVAGGFWNSGIKSSCRERRYSYFSQNRHNPVGFRCCKDIENAGQRRKK
ncbi:MAG TPA: SUMF1/EgtB/PvdO family nonheme iron enzyme [Chitinispirillaceae bacterium]|nr:SUMF1/EgtB/PvdO family nonheme iron enzyme [Chitinispirillaceae bacterium]